MTYASVNGLQLYYETHGSGRPLVLLHGGLMTIDMNFGPLLGPLAASRQVIAVELQGHGHTADIDRPLSVPALADDIASGMKLAAAQSRPGDRIVVCGSFLTVAPALQLLGLY